MSQLQFISAQLQNFFSDANPELEFLFDSLLISLKTASKRASTTSISRSLPSIKHASNLSHALNIALLRLPVPSLHQHVDDLFGYFEKTLEENSHVPVSSELDELRELTLELRKGIHSLSSDESFTRSISLNIDVTKNSLRLR